MMIRQRFVDVAFKDSGTYVYFTTMQSGSITESHMHPNPSQSSLIRLVRAIDRIAYHKKGYIRAFINGYTLVQRLS